MKIRDVVYQSENASQEVVHRHVLDCLRASVALCLAIADSDWAEVEVIRSAWDDAELLLGLFLLYGQLAVPEVGVPIQPWLRVIRERLAVQ